MLSLLLKCHCLGLELPKKVTAVLSSVEKTHVTCTPGPSCSKVIGLNLFLVSFSFVQKHFLGYFFLFLLEYSIIKLYVQKRSKLNFLFKFSYLNSNFVLSLGYLKPALNKPAQETPEIRLQFTMVVVLWSSHTTT